MEKAKAAVFIGVNKPFEVREYPVLPAPAGMAGLSLLASGVCGTDIHFHKGRLALEPEKIIGHEFVGVIEDISPEDSVRSGLRAGDRAIVDIACPCGKCELCKSGDDANCVNMAVTNGGDPAQPPHLHGGYAEATFAPVENLIKIPDELDPAVVCVYACAGSTAMHAFRLAERAGAQLGGVKTAVVQGLGPVGTFAAAFLAAHKVKNIIAITGRNNESRAAAARRLGATEVFSMSGGGAAEKIMELTGGLGADLVFEASGARDAFPFGLEILRNRGVYLVPGQYSVSGGVTINPEAITFKALHIIGSSQYSVCDVKAYIEFLKENPELCGIIASLATAYDIEDINTAIADAEAGRNIKTILVKKDRR